MFLLITVILRTSKAQLHKLFKGSGVAGAFLSMQFICSSRNTSLFKYLPTILSPQHVDYTIYNPFCDAVHMLFKKNKSSQIASSNPLPPAYRLHNIQFFAMYRKAICEIQT